MKVFVCNVATQPGETDSFSCGDHVQALEDHVGSGLFDMLVCNHNFDGALLDGMDWVQMGDSPVTDYAVYNADLVSDEEPWHHDEEKLAHVLVQIYQARTGPLVD